MEKDYIKHILGQLSPEYTDLLEKNFTAFMEKPEISARIKTLQEELSREVKLLWMDYLITAGEEEKKGLEEAKAETPAIELEKAGIKDTAASPLEQQAAPAPEAITDVTTLPEDETKMDEPIIQPGGGNYPVPNDPPDDNKDHGNADNPHGPGKWPARSMSFVLPNGMVGKPYSTVLEFLPSSNAGVHYQVEGINDLGLLFDKDARTLSGTPSAQGDHKIYLAYRITYASGKFEDKYYVLQLIINHDPRSLWKNIDPDKNDPYWKPNEDKATLITPERVMVAASKRGRSHAHEGTFRDDDFGFRYMKDTGWHIVAVADGAGSAKYSRRGAQIACETALNYLEKILSAEMTENIAKLASEYNLNPSPETSKPVADLLYSTLGNSASHSYNAILDEATEKSALPKDYSTTFIVSIAKKFPFGYFVAAFWVGDGGVGIYEAGKGVKILGESDGGEFAGQTRFLTMKETVQPVEVFRRIRFNIVEDFTALVLMSDGITDAKFQTDNNLARLEKWDELWKDITGTVELSRDNNEMDQQLLDWLDFWSPGNHDDRTIAIVF